MGSAPAHDNHFHCREDGWLGLKAAERFQAAGGTSLVHVRLPTYPTDVAGFEASCRRHLAFSAKIRALGLTVWSAVGPYPLEIMRVAEAKGWPAAQSFGRACYAAAGKILAAGDAHCLGEVGRAHFPVEPDVQRYLDGLLEGGMAVARDAGVPVMLHTEHAVPETMAGFARMADRATLPRERVMKHYCGPLVKPEEHHGLVPSIIAGRTNIHTALENSPDGRFLLETDYIDEPTRPDVVMPPDTVPKRVAGFLKSGKMSEKVANAIGLEWPHRLYGAP